MCYCLLSCPPNPGSNSFNDNFSGDSEGSKIKRGVFSWLPLPSTWCLLSKYWCLRCIVLQLPAVPPLQPRNILVEDAAVGFQRPRWPAPLISPTCCVTSAESLHLQKFTFSICLMGRIILPTPCDCSGD